MKNQSVRPPDQVENAIREYSVILFRICFVLLCNKYDAEEAIQETFIRYMQKSPEFSDSEHEKAWLISVASNLCKDMLRFRKRHSNVALEDAILPCSKDENNEVLKLIMTLPEKYKTVILLHYVHGYKTDEISKMLKASQNTIKKRLERGRNLLKLFYDE